MGSPRAYTASTSTPLIRATDFSGCPGLLLRCGMGSLRLSKRGPGSVGQVAVIKLRINAEGTEQEANFTHIVGECFKPGEGGVDVGALLSAKVKPAQVKPVHRCVIVVGRSR